MREFAPDNLPAMHRWAPEAIVGPLATVLTLADQRLRGLADLASLRIAVVVLTDIDGEPLWDDYRELLWQAFQVPVFEQLRGPDGVVLARECEVHDGLHLDPGAKLTPEIEIALLEIEMALLRDHCECGLETPRLMVSRASPRRLESADSAPVCTSAVPSGTSALRAKA